MNPADPSYVPFSMFRRIFLCEGLLLISIAPRSLEVNDSRVSALDRIHPLYTAELIRLHSSVHPS